MSVPTRPSTPISTLRFRRASSRARRIARFAASSASDSRSASFWRAKGRSRMGSAEERSASSASKGSRWSPKVSRRFSISANPQLLQYPAPSKPSRYQRSKPSSSTASPTTAARPASRPAASRPSREDGQRTASAFPSSERQRSTSPAGSAMSTETTQGSSLSGGRAGPVPAASAGTWAAAGSAPFSGTPGAPASGGCGKSTPAGAVAPSATRMGTRIAWLPAAFASPACSGPDSATCRVLGKVTSRAIGTANPNTAQTTAAGPVPATAVRHDRGGGGEKAPVAGSGGRPPVGARGRGGRGGGGGGGGPAPVLQGWF